MLTITSAEKYLGIKNAGLWDSIRGLGDKARQAVEGYPQKQGPGPAGTAAPTAPVAPGTVAPPTAAPAQGMTGQMVRQKMHAALKGFANSLNVDIIRPYNNSIKSTVYVMTQMQKDDPNKVIEPAAQALVEQMITLLGQIAADNKGRDAQMIQQVSALAKQIAGSFTEGFDPNTEWVAPGQQDAQGTAPHNPAAGLPPGTGVAAVTDKPILTAAMGIAAYNRFLD